MLPLPFAYAPPLSPSFNFPFLSFHAYLCPQTLFPSTILRTLSYIRLYRMYTGIQMMTINDITITNTYKQFCKQSDINVTLNLWSWAPPFPRVCCGFVLKGQENIARVSSVHGQLEGHRILQTVPGHIRIRLPQSTREWDPFCGTVWSLRQPPAKASRERETR